MALLNQVVLNAVSSIAMGASNTCLRLNASGYHTDGGVEAVFDITCNSVVLSETDMNQIAKLCQASNLTDCLKVESVDPSIVVAKTICLDLGWHLEYQKCEGNAGNFFLVFPALRFENEMLLHPD